MKGYPDLGHLRAIEELTRASQEIADFARATRLKSVIAEYDQIAKLNAEVVRRASLPARWVSEVYKHIETLSSGARLSAETNSAILNSVAEMSAAMRASADLERFTSAQRLVSLVPSHPGWPALAGGLIESEPLTEEQIPLSPEAKGAIEEGLEHLFEIVSADDPTEVADGAPELVAELIEVVEASAPKLHDELLVAGTEEARLQAFVTWWRALPPIVQLLFAILLQWLTVGLASQYLKHHDLLPGLGSTEHESDE